jgi:hypothetical protein
MQDTHAQNREYFALEADRKLTAEQRKQMAALVSQLDTDMINSFKVLIEFLKGNTTKTEVVNQLTSISTPDVAEVVEAVDRLDNTIKQEKLDLAPLEEQLKLAVEQLTSIPKTLPDAPEAIESVKVSNLAEIDLKPLLDAVNALDLKVEAPVVNVDAPKVEVAAPDLKPIKELFTKLLAGVKAIKMPDVKVEATDTSKIESELEKQTEKLDELIKQPKGGGGGGSGVSFQDSAGRPVRVELEADGSIPTTGTSQSLDYSLVQFDDTSSASYEYYAYMDKDANWYIKRLTTATNLFEFTAPVATSYSTGWTNRATLTYLEKGMAF